MHNFSFFSFCGGEKENSSIVVLAYHLLTTLSEILCEGQDYVYFKFPLQNCVWNHAILTSEEELPHHLFQNPKIPYGRTDG